VIANRSGLYRTARSGSAAGRPGGGDQRAQVRHSWRRGTLAPHMCTRKPVPATESGAPADREGRRVNFRRRRRRHTSLLPLRSIEQVRRENAILVGACTLIILAALLVGAGLAWWVL